MERSGATAATTRGSRCRLPLSPWDVGVVGRKWRGLLESAEELSVGVKGGLTVGKARFDCVGVADGWWEEHAGQSKW